MLHVVQNLLLRESRVVCMSKKQNTATKQYECHICGEPILKGNDYISIHIKDGHLHRQVRQHIHCDAISEEVCTIKKIPYYSDDFYDFLHQTCILSCGEEKAGICSVGTRCNCETVCEMLLHPTVLSAAIQSIRENTIGGDR